MIALKENFVFIDQPVRDAYLQFLVNWNALDEVAALDVLDQQKRETPPIGRLALEARILSMKQVFQILNAQADSDLRFGEIAMGLGFMKGDQLLDLLETQKKRRPGLNKIIAELGFVEKESLNTLRQEFFDHIMELVA